MGVWPVKTSASKPLGMVVCVSGGSGCSQKYLVDVDTKNFDPSCETPQDKDDWRLRIKRQLANPGLPGSVMSCHVPCVPRRGVSETIDQFSPLVPLSCTFCCIVNLQFCPDFNVINPSSSGSSSTS